MDRPRGRWEGGPEGPQAQPLAAGGGAGPRQRPREEAPVPRPSHAGPWPFGPRRATIETVGKGRGERRAQP